MARRPDFGQSQSNDPHDWLSPVTIANDIREQALPFIDEDFPRLDDLGLTREERRAQWLAQATEDGVWADQMEQQLPHFIAPRLNGQVANLAETRLPRLQMEVDRATELLKSAEGLRLRTRPTFVEYLAKGAKILIAAADSSVIFSNSYRSDGVWLTALGQAIGIGAAVVLVGSLAGKVSMARYQRRLRGPAPIECPSEFLSLYLPANTSIDGPAAEDSSAKAKSVDLRREDVFDSDRDAFIDTSRYIAAAAMVAVFAAMALVAVGGGGGVGAFGLAFLSLIGFFGGFASEAFGYNEAADLHKELYASLTAKSAALEAAATMVGDRDAAKFNDDKRLEIVNRRARSAALTVRVIADRTTDNPRTYGLYGSDDVVS